MYNLNWIINKFKEFNDKPFLIDNDDTISYADLIKNTAKWQERLHELKILEGDIIAVIGDYSPEVIYLFLALALNKNIIVPLSNETLDKHDMFLQIAHVNGFFKFAAENKWKFHSRHCSTSHDLLNKLKSDQESGLVIFTSGTTGQNKGTVLQVSKLIDKYKTLKKNHTGPLFF